MNQPKSYHVVVEIVDDYGKLRFNLFFPSPQLRRLFCAMHPNECSHVGRRPLVATKSDLERTRMNLVHYPQFRDFIPFWDMFVSKA